VLIVVGTTCGAGLDALGFLEAGPRFVNPAMSVSEEAGATEDLAAFNMESIVPDPSWNVQPMTVCWAANPLDAESESFLFRVAPFYQTGGDKMSPVQSCSCSEPTLHGITLLYSPPLALDQCDFWKWEVYGQADPAKAQLDITVTDTDPWTLYNSPTDLNDICDRGYTVTDLDPEVWYRFKIRVVCTNFPGVDNDYDSPPCFWTQTLPLPSSQPAPPTLTTSRAWEIPSGNTYSYVNTFTIAWQPQHNPNQCRFKKWIVEWRLSPAGPFVDGGIWYEALCLPESVYTRSTLNSCELKGHISGGTSEVEALRGCGWWFEARISEACDSEKARSPPSAPSAPAELLVGIPGGCPHGRCASNTTGYTGCAVAGQPYGQNAGQPSAVAGVRDAERPEDTVVVTWEPGAPGDCVFVAWKVQARSEGRWSLSDWDPAVQGCRPENLTNRSATSCTATGLSSLTKYTFAVRETCTLFIANSPFSEPSAPVRTGPRPAEPPGSFVVASTTAFSMTLTWEQPVLNDCDFESYLVLMKEVGVPEEEAYAPAGCQAMTVQCTTSCTALGVLPATSYQFTIATLCLSMATDSAVSPWTVSPMNLHIRGYHATGQRERVDPLQLPVAATLPTRATRIVRPLVSEITASSVRVTWEKPVMNNCDFYDYYVSMTSDRVASGMQAHGCRNITDEDTTTCVAEVPCNTELQFTVQTRC
jgi:hypothetical protein